MKTLKDMLDHQKELKERLSRINGILSVMSDARYEDDDRRVRIDGLSSIYMPLAAVVPVLETERDRVQAEIDRVDHALNTACDVANGLINKPA